MTIDELIDSIRTNGIEETVREHRKPPVPSLILRELFDDYADDALILEFLASYPLIPSDLAERIIDEFSNGPAKVFAALAKNPRSSMQTLAKINKRKETNVLVALASNTNLSPKEFSSLVKKKSPFVKAALAGNPALPKHLSFILATDKSPTTRAALATRSSLDIDIVVKLAKDENIFVRKTIISQNNADKEFLQLLADEDEELSQLMLLDRKKLDSNALNSLLYSPNQTVRKKANRSVPLNKAKLVWLLDSEDVEDRCFLAELDHLPVAIQRQLAKDVSTKVRRKLASNEGIEEAIAKHIASSSDIQACIALAKNPRISSETVDLLCQHPDDQVALLIAYREDIDEEHVNLLINNRPSHISANHIAFQQINYTGVREIVANAFAESENPSLKTLAARSSEINPDALIKLSRDKAAKVRLAAANNSRTPESSLRELCYDVDKTIVEQSEKTLSRVLHPEASPDANATQTSSRDTSNSPAERSDFLGKIKKFFRD